MVWGRTRGREGVLLFKRFTVEPLQTARLLVSYSCCIRCGGLYSFLNCFLVMVFVLTIESYIGVAHRLVEETDIAAQHYDNI